MRTERRVADRGIARWIGTVAGAALVLMVGTTFGDNAKAETADGETPANEGVCDVLKDDGVTKGLYGLCVAYCEAQDLDEVGDKEAPNNKILDNYNRKKGSDDPDMPCLQAPCPCWDETELARITESGGSLSCNRDDDTAVIRNSSPLQFAIADTVRPACRFTDTSVDPPVSVRFQGFTAEEGQSCYDQIVNACTSLGM